MDGTSEDPRQTPFHPRMRFALHGQDEAEQKLLHAYVSGRLHHAWLLTGQPGIGKATLAYRFARFVLANPDHQSISQHTLNVDPENPAARRISARGHADLLTIERAFDEKTKRIKANIDVAQARRATKFYTHTAGEGGWRVCIVDAADDLNIEAANALLKILEEPPERSLFLLVSHSPGRLLATIRSRCIQIQLAQLDDQIISKIIHEIDPQCAIDQSVVTKFAAGSAGRALQMSASGASRKFSQFLDIVDNGAPYNRKSIWALCDHLAQRKNDEDYRLFCELLQQWVMIRAQVHAISNDRASIASQLAEHSFDIGHSIRRANALNLDRREVILDAIESIAHIEMA